jgi:hypothetical protein
MRVARWWAGLAAVVAAMLVAGCGGGSAPTPPQLSGARLKTALLPGSAFPAGYAIYSKNSYESGDRIKPFTRYSPATISCGTFAIQLGAPGFGETAMATNEFISSNRDLAYVQLIYQFADPNTASTFFSGLRAATLRCRSFTATEYGYASRITQHVSATTSVSGHQAMQINQVERAALGSGAASQVDYLFVLGGADVYGTIRVGSTSAPPANPSAPAVIARLITRVAALH